MRSYCQVLENNLWNSKPPNLFQMSDCYVIEYADWWDQYGRRGLTATFRFRSSDDVSRYQYFVFYLTQDEMRLLSSWENINLMTKGLESMNPIKISAFENPALKICMLADKILSIQLSNDSLRAL